MKIFAEISLKEYGWDQLARFIANSKGYPDRDNYGWDKVGKHLKAKGTIEDGDGLWIKYYDPDPDDSDDPECIEGTDDYGFAAIPGGFSEWIYGGEFNFDKKDYNCYFWSSNSNDEYFAIPYILDLGDDFDEGKVFILTGYYKGFGMSVRCIKD